jgi:outer membrane protein assembly factor BamB
MLLWHTTLPAMVNAAPVLDGVHLFLTDDVGTLYQVDARTGTVRHRMHLRGSIHNLGLVLARGTLFVPNATGGLVYAIPEHVLTTASTVDVAPPLGPVVGHPHGGGGG